MPLSYVIIFVLISSQKMSLSRASEMYEYSMHFLEPARFLYTPDLSGHKVNLLYNPGLAQRPPPTPAVYIPVGVWALKQPLSSHLHKITNDPVFFIWHLPLIILMRAKDITWAIGRVGP